MAVMAADKGYRDEKILIVGGGVAGLMSKNRLESLGYNPVLAEQADALRSEGAGILLGANVLKIFRECGLEDELLHYAQPLKEIRLLDEQGRRLGRFDLEKIARETSYPTVAVHRKRLHEILMRSVDAESIRLSHKVISITKLNAGYHVQFDNGEVGTYDYIIGADGVRSKVREQFFGNIPLRYAGYVCWRFVCDLPPGIDRMVGSEYWGSNKRVGIFPIGEGKAYCFMLASAVGGEEKLGFEEVMNNFNEFQGDWQTIASMLAPDTIELIYGPIADLSKNVLHVGRMILVGDAGHATTPNLGQGAAMGIEGAYVFGELLKTYSLDDAMKHYSQTRLERVNDIRNRSWLIGRLAHLESPVWQTLRNFVMRITPHRINQKEFEKAIFHQ
ncbi:MULTISPECIES: FAD-dependent monooxygenase [unclassified Sulfuricurvum]|uniref:FAD-dependent monooxygenase n=1 Tax=unclassified Sulfuricurvum TaxID=2632390 RepID=UPI000AEFD7F1|nr:MULTISPECIES: FAD-dependent monooxygenase [unclassified Sulfuricurvum]